MSLLIVLQSILAAFIGGIVYTIIGIIPGTDETATMAPITLVLVLTGVNPIVIYSFVIAQIVAMQISHTIPTAMAALPGSTMSVPMVRYAQLAKRLGIPHIAMRKLATGSLVGTLVSVPSAMLIAYFLAPLGTYIEPYTGLIFTIGAIFIAYLSAAKWAAVVALIPISFLIQGIQRLAIESVGHTLFISIFMGITVGPMISELFNVLVPKLRKAQQHDGVNEIWLAPDANENMPYFPNPFKLLTKTQRKTNVITSVIGSAIFMLSPVGATVLIGEIIAGRSKGLYEKITNTLSAQDAVATSTYMGGLLIPLLAFGLPLSPVALGPTAPVFNAPPVFTVDPINNLSSYLEPWHYIVFGFIGIVGGAMIAYPIAVKQGRKWTVLMFKYISHEALIGSFLGLIVMLSYYEAGFTGIIASLVIGLFGGILHNLFEVHTGVQFMAYYASGFIVTTLLSIG